MKAILLGLFLFISINNVLNKSIRQSELEIRNLQSSCGREYGINKLIGGEYQYMDRSYQFNYIPEELIGCTHIKTCGNDKLIGEKEICVSFEVNCDVDVYILFADKFPVLPQWLNQYERTRLNITRLDSRPDNLKGYFSLYRKSFSKGKITLNGCSPSQMLEKEWYIQSGGANYCMYTIVIKKKN